MIYWRILDELDRSLSILCYVTRRLREKPGAQQINYMQKLSGVWIHLCFFDVYHYLTQGSVKWIFLDLCVFSLVSTMLLGPDL